MDFDKKHNKNLEAISKKIKEAYLKAINMVVSLSTPLPLNADKEFYFKTHPQLNNNINYLLEQLYSNVYADTVMGINTSWDIAVEKNNAIAEQIYGKGLEQLPTRYRKRYLSNNAQARKNFVYRKTNGLGLSDKVWKNTQQFKQELELALEVGLYDGKSAQSIAKNVKQYLKDPDKLFRRVRNKENGILRLSKAAKAYNPGQGRYRSSYKNALRLTRNEINFSYEGSQEEKRKQQDFIVGIEIKVSPSHKPSDDKGGVKCIRLQGKYPKDFKWTHKWHVNCKCMSLNILKSQEELDSDLDRILSGEEPLEYSDNQVLSIPAQYDVIANDKRFSNSRTFANNKDYKERTVEKVEIIQPLNRYIKGFSDVSNLSAEKKEQIYQEDVSTLSVSEDTKWSLKMYRGARYSDIRGLLTGTKTIKDVDYKEVVQKDINNISEFISKNPLKESKVVYRMLKGDTVINKFNKMEIGSIFEDLSFGSSSLEPQLHFGRYELKILAPKGSSVTPIFNKDELEYLIQKGSKFKILDKSDSGMVVQLL